MKAITFFVVYGLIPVFIAGFYLPAHAGLMSDGYRIPTSVLSGGGVHMASGSYQTEASMGQPSPLGEQGIFSEHYALYSGFWYEMGTIHGTWPMPWLLLLLEDNQEMEFW